jgi:predicted peptidase
MNLVKPRSHSGKHGSKVLIFTCVCLWGVMISAAGCSTHPVQTGQHAHAFEQDDLRINYLLFLPEDYGRNRSKRWPLILFLHGSGERSSTVEELERLKAHGLPRLIAEQPDLNALTTRFIVLSPQCPGWYWRSQFDALDALLDDIQATYAVDPKRIYMTGLSMGGFGAWQYALKHPRRFAALVPIAGGYGYHVETVYIGGGQSEIDLTIDTSPPENMCDLKNVPAWVFHGEKDTGIPHEQTADVLVDALQVCGGKVRYTLYPDTGHDAWTETYSDPALYSWLLAQQRPGG